MKKIISRKGIVLIVIPLFTIFLQIFLRWILKKDLNTIGITLASLGVGQLLPFFYFDHFVANKLLGIKPAYKVLEDEFQISYKLAANVSEEEIEGLKNWFMLAIFLNLGLFLVTVYFGLVEKVILHIIFGLVSCIISWYLLIFK